MSLAQGNNTPTRPRIEPGSPHPESDALTTRPVRPLVVHDLQILIRTHLDCIANVKKSCHMKQLLHNHSSESALQLTSIVTEKKTSVMPIDGVTSF